MFGFRHDLLREDRLAALPVRFALAALVTLFSSPVLASDAPQLTARPQQSEIIAAAAGIARTAAAETCRPVVPENAEGDLRSRFEAYGQLECIVEKVEHVLQGASGEDGTVALTRADLEELRNRAIWAKVAAEQIGRH